MPRTAVAVGDQVMVTTRERIEALLRHLSNSYLGYDKDDGKVRELMADARRALGEEP